MKRLYYGSVTCERMIEHRNHITNIAMLCFATSVEEAKGWAVSEVQKRYPQGKLSVVQMFAVPDDWVLDAAKLLNPEKLSPLT